MIAQSKAIRKSTSLRHPAFTLDNKLTGYEFAQSLGQLSPKIQHIQTSLAHIPFAPNTVVKPMQENSAHGVFICHADGRIIYLNKGTVFDNPEAARTYAKDLLIQNIVHTDSWMSEELIANANGLARDIKLYCFYGEIGLILETQREGPRKRCWMSEDLRIVNTGKYSKNSYISSTEHLPELITLAKDISLEIPSPFIRIDFLVQQGQFYIGEFTPIPGKRSNFSDHWDSILGGIYSKAITRLAFDVSLGKKFEHYLKLSKTKDEAIARLQQQLT